MTDATAFVAGGSAAQPQRLVIGAGATLDEVQASGRWLAAADPVEVRQ